MDTAVVVVLVPLGVFALVVALLLLVAYVFDWWPPMLFFGIPLAAGTHGARLA